MVSEKPNIIETEIDYIVEGDLILEEDFKTKKNLIVRGNIQGKSGLKWDINARDINARDINARDINARDIDAWNIDAWDIDAWDIDARDINARDIICEKRKKKSASVRTTARIYIKNKSKIERKEYEN